MHDEEPFVPYNSLPLVEPEAGIVNATSPKDAKTAHENTELVQGRLVQLVAADAPSHRSAWRKDTKQLWQALEYTTNRSFILPQGKAGQGGTRRRESDEESGDEVDGPDVGIMATSVPINIPPPGTWLERKTSLTDRQGELVPGLRMAMKK